VPVLRRTFILFVLAVALAAVTATPTFAAPSPVIADCNSHGALTKHYSVAQLHTALATMSPDVQEYTDCYNVIQSQLQVQVAGHTGDSSNGSGSGGGGLSTTLVIVLVVLIVGGGAVAGLALQRRGGASGGS
jgi:cell division protein FtsW (lipid II flippase)